jgi:hypothetical protein
LSKNKILRRKVLKKNIKEIRINICNRINKQPVIIVIVIVIFVPGFVDIIFII